MGTLIADNYAGYLLTTYLFPAATAYLRALPEDKRAGYLAANSWISYTNNTATFAFPHYLAHVGRMKGLPAFDDFDIRQPEPNLFGTRNTPSRHFTSVCATPPATPTPPLMRISSRWPAS